MARPIEELVRPFQLPPGALRIPVDASLATGRVSVSSAVPVLDEGGSGYVVDDTIVLGGGAGIAAQLRVSEVDGLGAIVALTIDSGGSYTILPATPASQKSTSGIGSGALLDVGSAGENNVIRQTYKGVGKLPAPVSDVIGIKFCRETWDEVPGTRQTHNVKINDDTGSGAFITVARTDKLTMKKKADEQALDDDAASYVHQDFADLAADLQTHFEPTSNKKQDRCDIDMKFQNPA